MSTSNEEARARIMAQALQAGGTGMARAGLALAHYLAGEYPEMRAAAGTASAALRAAAEALEVVAVTVEPECQGQAVTTKLPSGPESDNRKRPGGEACWLAEVDVAGGRLAYAKRGSNRLTLAPLEALRFATRLECETYCATANQLRTAAGQRPLRPVEHMFVGPEGPEAA